MKAFVDRQIQFEQVFDGAYGYLDNCGQFMEAVRKQLDFMHVSVTPTGCDMESVNSAIRLQASIDHLLITATELDSAPELIKSADYCSMVAGQLFGPFRLEYNRVTFSSAIPVDALEESFALSRQFMPSFLMLCQSLWI
jgi:hypothetical protein